MSEEKLRTKQRFDHTSQTKLARAVNKRSCLQCKTSIAKAVDAFHYIGMEPYTYYCRPCYFKKLG